MSVEGVVPKSSTHVFPNLLLDYTFKERDYTFKDPALTDTSSQNVNSLQEAVVNNASAAVNAIQNHPITQNVKDTVTNGPVAESIKNQSTATSREFSGLASSRTQPSHTAATGQSLTHYHSFFYTLLSWEHPRATAVSFASTIIFIFACRYLPILSWACKISYTALGVASLAELVGKFVMGQGLTSTFRPRKYYKIPKETLESSLDDLEQLINFFVIEFQRILFAERPIVTVGAFTCAFISYYLIKIVPVWGMLLLTTCMIYLAPLIYISNRELIDDQLNHATDVISAQAAQVKDLAGHHAGNAIESAKAYTGAGAAKAQELVGSARQRIPSPPSLGRSQQAGGVKEADFPATPRTNFPSTAEYTRPVVASQNGEPVIVT